MERQNIVSGGKIRTGLQDQGLGKSMEVLGMCEVRSKNTTHKKLNQKKHSNKNLHN
jgi:hypothetical protein